MLIIGQMKLLACSHSLLWVYVYAAYLCCCCFLEGPTALYFSRWGLSFDATCWAVWACRGKYEVIVNSAVLLNSTFLRCCDADIPSTQAVMQELIFAIDGVGVWASTLVNNQLWRGCETHYWSRAEKSVAVVLYNYRWSQKMPRAKHNLLFVMLDCLSRLCQAAVFCSRVPIPCLFILCAVSFHISLVIPSWKMNSGFVQGL